MTGQRGGPRRNARPVKWRDKRDGDGSGAAGGRGAAGRGGRGKGGAKVVTAKAGGVDVFAVSSAGTSPERRTFSPSLVSTVMDIRQ